MDKEYRIGDIVIFKAEDEWLSQCIAKLTDSDVSHAAMIYDEKKIVEVGARGTEVHNVSLFAGDGAYLMRLKPELDYHPLVESANHYINAKTRYDFVGLVFLGGLLIYQKMIPTKSMLSITNKILQSACLELDRWIQDLIHQENKEAVICSGLIYQIYCDCGGDYELEIKNGTFLRDTSSHKIRIADLLHNSYEQIKSNEVLNVQSEEELYQELYQALDESNRLKDNIISLETLYQNPVLSLAKDFVKKVEIILHEVGSKTPIDSLFVTPADLAYHTENLEKICSFGIQRIKS